MSDTLGVFSSRLLVHDNPAMHLVSSIIMNEERPLLRTSWPRTDGVFISDPHCIDSSSAVLESFLRHVATA